MTTTTHTDVKPKVPARKGMSNLMIFAIIATILVLGGVAAAVAILVTTNNKKTGPEISLTFTLSGDVSDFSETDKTNILDQLAIAAGFSSTPSGSEITITPASVDVVATFPVADATEATTARTSLDAAVGTTAGLQNVLTTAMGTSAPTVVSAPTFAADGLTMPPTTPPPAPPPPPRLPPHDGPFSSGCQSIPLAGRWIGNYGTSFVINNTMWLSVSSGETHKVIVKFTLAYAILQVPDDDKWNPGKFQKIEYHSYNDGTWGMCTSVMSASSATEAENTDTSTIYDASEAGAGGCGQYSHTIMTTYEGPLSGQWVGNYGTQFSIDNDFWREGDDVMTIFVYTAKFYIFQMPSDDNWNPSKFVKAEFHANGDGTYGMCKSVMSAATAKLAINTDTSTIYNASEAGAGGCSQFSHTVMSSSEETAPVPSTHQGPLTHGTCSIPLAGRWIGNYGNSFVINNTMWLSVSSGETHKVIIKFTLAYAILRVPDDDKWNAGKYQKVEYHSNSDGTYGFCTSVMSASSATEAENTNTTTIYDASKAGSGGCGQFSHSIITTYDSPLAGQWVGNYGTKFVIDNDFWREDDKVMPIFVYTATFYIIQMPPDDLYNANKFVKAEFHANGDGTHGMCKSVMSAETAKQAINTDTSTIYNASEAGAGGCSQFSHTVMTAVTA